MSFTIDINNLTKTYGKNRGVEKISLEINNGIIYGFIGPNGAGKSTTIKSIMRYININEGTISILGKSNNDDSFDKDMKANIGYLPSEIHLYNDLTVKQMFDYTASFYQQNCQDKIDYLVEKLEIDLSKKIDELSLGNLKKVGIVIALMHNPKIIIMDEATSGLDPLMQEVFYDILIEEKKKGHTIFFSSHNLSEVKKICDVVAIIKEGKIIDITNINELNKNNYYHITIDSLYTSDIKSHLSIDEKNILQSNENNIEFIYTKNINILITSLAKFTSDNKINHLYINELDLESLFLHYYK